MRSGVYYSYGGTVRGLPSLSDAYWIMAGCTDRWALTSIGALGVTRVSRSAVFNARVLAGDGAL